MERTNVHEHAGSRTALAKIGASQNSHVIPMSKNILSFQTFETILTRHPTSPRTDTTFFFHFANDRFNSYRSFVHNLLKPQRGYATRDASHPPILFEFMYVTLFENLLEDLARPYVRGPHVDHPLLRT